MFGIAISAAPEQSWLRECKEPGLTGKAHFRVARNAGNPASIAKRNGLKIETYSAQNVARNLLCGK